MDLTKDQVLKAIDPSHFTHEEMVMYLEKIVQFVIDAKKMTETEIEAIRQALDAVKEQITADNAADVSTKHTEVQAALATVGTRTDAAMQQIAEKLGTVQNGKDADEPAIIQSVLDQIQLPEQKEQLLDTPEDIRNKLEVLQGEERLKMDAILGLAEELKALRTEIGKKPTTITGGGLIGREYVRAYDISAQLNGSTKTFNTPGMWRVISVHLSSFPNILRENVDYTWTPTSVTFSAQIDAPSSLSNGQTCVIVYMTS